MEDVVITVPVLFIWLAEDKEKVKLNGTLWGACFDQENPNAEYFIMLLWYNDDKQTLMYKRKVIKFHCSVFLVAFPIVFSKN